MQLPLPILLWFCLMLVTFLHCSLFYAEEQDFPPNRKWIATLHGIPFRTILPLKYTVAQLSGGKASEEIAGRRAWKLLIS
jgi:hypothetical protein